MTEDFTWPNFSLAKFTHEQIIHVKTWPSENFSREKINRVAISSHDNIFTRKKFSCGKNAHVEKIFM